MNKIKTYFKDLWELQLHTNEFNKKHIVGNIVFSTTLGLGYIVGVVGITKTKEKFDEKKKSKEKELEKMSQQ